MTFSSSRIIKAGIVSQSVGVKSFELPSMAADTNGKGKSPVFPDFYLNTSAEEALPEEECEEEQEDLKEKEKERYLAEVQEEAEAILLEARAEAERMKEEALRRGQEEGYEIGFRAGQSRAYSDYKAEMDAETSKFHREMETALKDVSRAKETVLEKYLEELKDCSIAIAEKVMHISLKSSGEVIKRMIVAATEKLKKKEWVKIYMGKYDYDMMIEADANMVQELMHLSNNIKFVVMEQEEPGNCIIEMPDEIIDVSVNTQMENLKDILGNVRV